MAYIGIPSIDLNTATDKRLRESHRLREFGVKGMKWGVRKGGPKANEQVTHRGKSWQVVDPLDSQGNVLLGRKDDSGRWAKLTRVSGSELAGYEHLRTPAEKPGRPSADPEGAKAFKSQFPGAVAAIKEMAGGNDVSEGYDLGKVAADKGVMALAKQAEPAFRKMPSSDRETLAYGETRDQFRTAAKYGTAGKAAHRLLSRVFDHGFEND